MNKFKPITQDKLDAMKAREEAATSDGWVWEEGTNYIWRYWNGGRVKSLEHTGKLEWHEDSCCASVEAGHNLSFAAHARQDQNRLREGYQALLVEYEKQRECLREAKVQHRICRVYCVGLGDECDCGASEHNARIDAVQGREGHE